MKRNITKQLLHVRGSVRTYDSFACIGAGTARGGNSETRAFDAISISSVQKRGLFHVIAQSLFRQDRDLVVSKKYHTTLEGNVSCCLFQNTRIRDLQWQRSIFYHRLWCWVPAVQRGLSWQPSNPPGCAPAFMERQPIFPKFLNLVFCFIIKIVMYSMPYLFIRNFKNQDLWAKIFQLQQFQYFAIIFSYLINGNALFQVQLRLLHGSSCLLVYENAPASVAAR